MVKTWIGKYKSLPIQIKASLWFLVCQILQRGISVITTPIFTRILSTSEYGRYNVFNSWLGIVAVIVSLNLYAGVYAQGIVKFDNERYKFTSSLQGLCLTLCLLWSAVYLVFHNFFNKLFDLTTVQVLAMFVMIWASAVFNFWSVEQRVDFKYSKLVAISIVTSICKPALGVFLVLHSEDKVTARILGLALVEILAYFFMFVSHMRKGRTFFSKKYWKYALCFNIPLIPHYLSQTILNSADRIMIERMVGSSEAGIYSLAYSLSLLMTMLNTALEQTIEPWIYKKIKAGRIQDLKTVAYPAFLCIGTANLILIMFAPEIVRIFAPPEYYEAIWIIPPVAMSVYFLFMYSFLAAFEFYFEKPQYITVSTVLGAIVNIILNYFFIKWFGYIAAGYTTLFCYILYALFHYIAMTKICKKEFNGEEPYSKRIVLLISLLFLLMTGLLALSYLNNIVRYSVIGITIVLLVLFRKKIIATIKELINKRNE